MFRVQSQGRFIAAILICAWQEAPPQLDISDDELNHVTPLLIRSGAGALAWWRIRHAGLRDSDAALQLKEAYREQSFANAIYAQRLEQVLAHFHNTGIDPILVKGWAVARYYAQPALRPLGDIDLIVRPEEYERAQNALRDLELKNVVIDLHRGLDDTQHASHSRDQSLDELYARSQFVPLGHINVRVLAHEDHLRLVCLHLLNHGAWRPLWLCDVAAALEARPANFDWARGLGQKPYADWIACALGLAHQLLGANVGGTPIAHRAKNLPHWLIPTVLKQWEVPFLERHSSPEPIRYVWRKPMRLARALRGRWRDPIQATVQLGGSFNEVPRGIYQAADYVVTGAKFLTRPLQRI